MRLPLILSTLIVGAITATPVGASPITYSFTGNLNGLVGQNRLVQSDGTVVDLAGAAFTVTGTTVDTELRDLPDGLFDSTSTYDFGALGSFTTNFGGDTFIELGDGLGAITTIGLTLWYPSTIDYVQGFMVHIDPVTVAGTGPVALGTVTPLRTETGIQPSTLYNDAGQRLRIGPNLVTGVTPFTIVGASVVGTPEPSTLTVLALGLGAAWYRRRKKSQRNRAFNDPPGS